MQHPIATYILEEESHCGAQSVQTYGQRGRLAWNKKHCGQVSIPILASVPISTDNHHWLQREPGCKLGANNSEVEKSSSLPQPTNFIKAELHDPFATLPLASDWDATGTAAAAAPYSRTYRKSQASRLRQWQSLRQSQFLSHLLISYETHQSALPSIPLLHQQKCYPKNSIKSTPRQSHHKMITEIKSPNFLALLLESGDYFDFTIKCQGVEFKVHRAVVCAQSTMLKKAADGPFKVSYLRTQTGIVY